MASLNVFLESPSPLGYVRVANIISPNRKRSIGASLFPRPVWPGRIVGYDSLDDRAEQILPAGRQFKRKIYYILAEDWANMPNNYLTDPATMLPEDGILVKDLLAQSKWMITRPSEHYKCYIKEEDRHDD